MTKRNKALLFAGLAMAATGVNADASYDILRFSDLKGWSEDNHSAALSVFLKTCPDLKDQNWSTLCAVAQTEGPKNPRAFFELFFRPVMVTDGKQALFTGYFEPELEGSRTRSDRFRYPVYRMPAEARNQRKWLSRREILTSGVMDNRGLELAWVDDPVELFFLQIQGSGRIRLTNGKTMRIGFGGANGHPYKSIGSELVRRGVFRAHQVSAAVIRNWVRRNPVDGAELLLHNPSYVFFRELTDIDSKEGPKGAMNRPVTELRSIAVDPKFTPLGAPVWVEKAGRSPIRRLMIAQDTGSAIKGAQRADIFFGTGDEAGRLAGRLRDPGRMVVLMPIQTAYDLAPDGA